VARQQNESNKHPETHEQPPSRPTATASAHPAPHQQPAARPEPPAHAQSAPRAETAAHAQPAPRPAKETPKPEDRPRKQ